MQMITSQGKKQLRYMLAQESLLNQGFKLQKTSQTDYKWWSETQWRLCDVYAWVQISTCGVSEG